MTPGFVRECGGGDREGTEDLVGCSRFSEPSDPTTNAGVICSKYSYTERECMYLQMF